MFTEQELNSVFFWLKERKDWPKEPDEIEAKIDSLFGGLISCFTKSNLFETLYSQDGTGGNYLEFICFPIGHPRYFGQAIMVRTSLCSDIAAYGQVYFDKTADGYSYATLKPESIGVVEEKSLVDIEAQVVNILGNHRFKLLDKQLASRLLPTEIDNYLKKEVLYEGNQYLDGIFQTVE